MAERKIVPYSRAMDDRRVEARYLVKEDAFVWDLHHMKAGYQSARIVDVSRNGMRLELSGRLTRGSQVAIDFRGMIICGTIQYCGLIENGFALGIRIKDVLDPLREEPACDATNEEAGVEAAVLA
jgi:hypothetical protein